MIPADRALVLAHAAAAAASLVAYAAVRPPAPPWLAGRAGLLVAAARWGYWVTRPLLAGAERARIGADAVTLTGLALSVAAGAAAARGAWGHASVLLLWGGTCDLLDGEVARRRGVASGAGAFLDSSLDRLGEVAIFLGLAAAFPHRAGALAASAALAASLLVSYARARGEGLAVDCPSFGWERPHRLLLLVVALGAAPFLPGARGALLLELVCGALAVGAGLTAVARIAVIRRILRRREAER